MNRSKSTGFVTYAFACRSYERSTSSTSEAEEDILRSYDLHANAYVTKPVDVNQFVTAVRQIDEFFLSVVRLPRG